MTLNHSGTDPESPNVIVLRGQDEVEYKEQPADGAAITPGMVVERTANGIAPHGTDAGTVNPFVALGARKYGQTIDEDWAAGDFVLYAGFDKGQQFYGLLGAGENVAVGDDLLSAGDGTLRARVGDGTEAGADAVGEVVEAVDNSGGTEAARVKVEVKH